MRLLEQQRGYCTWLAQPEFEYDWNQGRRSAYSWPLHRVFALFFERAIRAEQPVLGCRVQDPDALADFAQALNQSRLRHLLLSSNAIGDNGAAAFLDVLAAPRLVELHLSAVGLGPASAGPLNRYLSSPRSASLRILKVNGNRLGDFSDALAKTLEHSNWWLEDLEAFGNDWPTGPMSTTPSGALVVRRHVTAFRAVLGRNKLLRLETRKNALALLRVARIVLLHPRPATSTALVLRRDYVHDMDQDVTTSPTSTYERAYFSWLNLPYELRLHVLRFVVPTSVLSPSQHSRVCLYAERAVPVFQMDVDEWLYEVGCAWFEPHANVFRQ